MRTRVLKFTKLIALTLVLSSTLVGSVYAYTYLAHDPFAPYSVMPEAMVKVMPSGPALTFGATSTSSGWFENEQLGRVECDPKGCTIPCESNASGRCLFLIFQRP